MLCCVVLWAPSSPSRVGWQGWAVHAGPSTATRPALLQNFLYKCVGTALGAASSRDVVRERLQELLESARYQEEAEREVPAPSPEPQAVGAQPPSASAGVRP